MNPLEQKIEQLEKQIADIRLAKDIVYTESVRKQVLDDAVRAGIKDDDTSDINTTTAVASTPSNVTHATPYDRRLRINIDGADYYIGLYNV